MSAPALSFRDAAVRIGGRTIWRGLNAEIERGEFVAVLGPNGVGKSTLIKAVVGLIPVSEGAVEVLGAPPGQHNREIGYLPQRRSFDAALRVRGIDIVQLGLDGDRWGLPIGRRRNAERVNEVIDLVGASAFASKPIGEVSGGEQQRVLIAQALVRQPELLLLDEPLDSLDLPNQAAVAELVASIARERGVTVLLVAHDVNPILPYLDRVIYLGHGGALIGPPEEVITGESLTQLYDTPIEVLRASDGRLVVVGQPEAPAHHHDRHEH
jgi:zinc/manganese transport system ATP-binding protein